MADGNLDTLACDVYYRGELVTALYSLDGENRSYQFVSNPNTIAEIIPLLEKETPETGGKAGFLGFLVFTNKGKYSYTISEGSDELLQYAKECNKTYSHARHAQWLCYMSPENIESFSFQGLDQSGEYSVYLKTKDPESLKKIASFLKNLTVEPNPGTHPGQTNPSAVTGSYLITMYFKTGTFYTMTGFDNGLAIYADDLDYSIAYKAVEQQIPTLRDFVALMPDARLEPFLP